MNRLHAIVRSGLVFVAAGVTVGMAAGVLAGCASTSKSGEAAVAGKESLVGGDPWFRAARESDIAVMRGMVEAGKPINFQSGVGTTALMIASRFGNPKTVQWLVENGASAAILDRDGQSALVYALAGFAQGPKLEAIVDDLVKAGANPFHIDTLGIQPVQQMVELGLDVPLRKLQYTDKKPCDRMPHRQGEKSLSRMARQMENVPLAEFLEAQGCW